MEGHAQGEQEEFASRPRRRHRTTAMVSYSGAEATVGSNSIMAEIMGSSSASAEIVDCSREEGVDVKAGPINQVLGNVTEARNSTDTKFILVNQLVSLNSSQHFINQSVEGYISHSWNVIGRSRAPTTPERA